MMGLGLGTSCPAKPEPQGHTEFGGRIWRFKSQRTADGTICKTAGVGSGLSWGSPHPQPNTWQCPETFVEVAALGV